jgi:hypothetical protein
MSLPSERAGLRSDTFLQATVAEEDCDFSRVYRP